MPNPQATLGEGAIQPWSQAHVADYFLRLMGALGEELGFDLNTPWEDLSAKAQKSVLNGHSTKVHVVTRNRYGRQRAYYAEFEGVRPYIERRHKEAESDTSRERFEGFMREVPCPTCRGSRLKPVSMAVTLGARRQGRAEHRRGLRDADQRDRRLPAATLDLSARERQIGERVLKEIQERLNFLLDVGLDYLSLNRPSGSLSRRRGPADPAGHPDRRRPRGRALRARRAVHRAAPARQPPPDRDPGPAQDLGNTLIVVEHDEDTIEVADWVVDVGPGAGEHGGQVVHSGSVQGLLERPDSLTGPYLSGRRAIPVPRVRRPRRPRADRARRRRTTCRTSTSSFPLGLFVAVTGVRLRQVDAGQRHPLHVAGQADLRRPHSPAGTPKIAGVEQVDKVIHVDQSPIGRTPRSNPATYTGVFDHVRKLFAATPEAKMRGYLPGRFSFNVKGGRCEACDGDGTMKIE